MRKLDMPWVVENVDGAGKAMNATLMLHGGMFGMGIHRPRLFESNVLLLAPRAPLTKSPIGVYDKGPRTVTHYRKRLNGNGKGRQRWRIPRTLDEAREVMGIDWISWFELQGGHPARVHRVHRNTTNRDGLDLSYRFR